MMHKLCVAAVLLAAVCGCAQQTPGTSRSLGDVEYDRAFDAGRQVMAQYFPLAQIDERRGLIISHPRPLAQQRLVGGSPVRQVAQLRLRREAAAVVAQASVQVQRQSSGAYRMQPPLNDSGPVSTPAEVEAATTADQNEVWTTLRQDHSLEARLLEQIYNRARHPVTTQKVVLDQ